MVRTYVLLTKQLVSLKNDKGFFFVFVGTQKPDFNHIILYQDGLTTYGNLPTELFVKLLEWIHLYTYR